MANPQLENGYTKISNELLEAICKTRLSDYEHRVLMMIIRKTYGFNKKADWICLKKLSDDTEIRLPHISRTITNLLERNIISKQKRKVSIQKDYEKWLPKEVTKTGGDWRNGNNWKSSTTKNIKDNILKRDNRECRVCGSKSDLCVHHIDYNQDNNKDDNLITLCRSCHQKTNSKNQSEWVTFLGNITQRGNHKKVTNPGNNITYTGNKKLPKQVDTKEKKETIQKKGSSKPKFSTTSTEFKLAEYLYKKIQNLDRKFPEPNLQSWAIHINRLIRLDKREPKLIREIIDWAHADSFWQTNILSTKKLREKFATLYLQSKKQRDMDRAKKADAELERKRIEAQRRPAEEPDYRKDSDPEFVKGQLNKMKEKLGRGK